MLSKEKMKVYLKDYYQKNKESIKDYQKYYGIERRRKAKEKKMQK